MDKLIRSEFNTALREHFISDLLVRSSDGVIVLYVPTECVSATVKTGLVSKKQLENFAKELSDRYSSGTEVIYVKSNKLELLGQGIEMLIRAQHGDIIEEVNFTFLSASKVNAWIKVKSDDESQKNAIKNYLVSVFADSDVNEVDVQWVNELGRLPSAIEILVMTKRLQPASINAYLSNFSSEYQGVSDSWLNRQLDKLIKKRLIIRDGVTKEYSLTGIGLGVIPNALSRTNSDISRALDLGRRKW